MVEFGRDCLLMFYWLIIFLRFKLVIHRRLEMYKNERWFMYLQCFNGQSFLVHWKPRDWKWRVQELNVHAIKVHLTEVSIRASQPRNGYSQQRYRQGRIPNHLTLSLNAKAIETHSITSPQPLHHPHNSQTRFETFQDSHPFRLPV